MKFEDIKEVISLHEKLSKNKKINKDILSFLEKQVKGETNIPFEDIKILYEAYKNIKAAHVKTILMGIIEGKSLEQPNYIPAPFIDKPFDPKPYWQVPPLSDNIVPYYSYTISTTNVPVEKVKGNANGKSK